MQAFTLFLSFCMSITGCQALALGPRGNGPLLVSREVPRYQPIEPEEIMARLGTTPEEYKPEERHAGMVYFCREENWGPPCFVYYPKLGYFCSELSPEIAGHVGSVFLEPGAICRLATGESNNRCQPTEIFAWPETKMGWGDLLHRDTPGGNGDKLGVSSTYFTCARCDNYVA